MQEDRFFIAVSDERWRPTLYDVVRDHRPTTIQTLSGLLLVTYSLKQPDADRLAARTNLIPRGLRRVKFSFRGKVPLIEREKAIVRIAFVQENGWPDERDERLYLDDELKALEKDLRKVSRGSFREYAWILEELFPCESATNVIEGHWGAQQRAKKALPLKNPIYAEAIGHVAMCRRKHCREFMKDYQHIFMDKARDVAAAFDFKK